jgi:hypothetical protein
VRDGPAPPVVRHDAPQPPAQVARHAILTAATGAETELTAEGPPSGRLHSSPTWSPDGRWLALALPKGQTGSDLVVWDEHGERIATRGRVITFVWRPESSGLVYVRQGGEMWGLPVTPEGGDERRISDAYAVTPRRPLSGRMLCRTPSWSLAVLDPGTLQTEEFTAVQIDPERWWEEICEPSPDGTKLVVFRDVTAAAGMVGSYLEVAVGYGSWSGDGRFILLRCCPWDGGWGMVNADTGQLTQLPGYSGGHWMARPTPTHSR